MNETILRTLKYKYMNKQKTQELYKDCPETIILDDVEYEIHADGVKEKKCDFCTEPCRTTWCPTEEE